MKQLLLVFSLAWLYAPAQNKAVLQADPAKNITISKNIYGHFAEHLGNCIYNGIYVGDTAKWIPNTEGVRNDIIAALRQLKVPVLRWPGGCFADTYHWKDGVGDKKKRPSIVNRWWGGVTEDNSFGTHDFLNFCERIGASPYLAGNVGSGTVQELADWADYVNGKQGSSPMSKWREQNGRAQPWNVRYWGVGNEVWGCGGNMKVEYYTNIYRQYATFLSGWSNDGGIVRVASGANSTDYHWTEVLMRDIPHDMLEAVALHHYAVIDWNAKGSATDFSEQQYFTTMKRALMMEELVTRHSTIMDRYDPAGKVGLFVDEWGGWYDVEPGTNPAFLFQQNSMRDAMLAGATLNIFNNHAARVKMANIAQTVNVLQAVILTNKEKIIMTPTFHVMEMYNVHQDAQLLPMELTTGNYTLGKESLPALSVSASRDKQGVTHLTVVNIDASKAQDLSVDIRGGKYSSVSGRILTSAKLQDHNTFEQPDRIRPQDFKGARISGSSLQMTVPPFSVVVLTLK